MTTTTELEDRCEAAITAGRNPDYSDTLALARARREERLADQRGQESFGRWTATYSEPRPGRFTGSLHLTGFGSEFDAVSVAGDTLHGLKQAASAFAASDRAAKIVARWDDYAAWSNARR